MRVWIGRIAGGLAAAVGLAGLLRLGYAAVAYRRYGHIGAARQITS
jgi:hypothetical protein